MADVYWIGSATAVAQVTTVQVTAYDAATTYTLTVGGQDIDTAGNTDVNTTASDIATNWNASTHAYFTGVTASSATDTVTLTADTAGVPFVVTSSVTGGTGTIGSPSTTTASSGPNDWSTAANWSGGSVPVSSDSVWIDKPNAKLMWGLDQNAVSLTELHIRNNVKIGLNSGGVATTSDGETVTTTAREYRQDYLKLGYTTCHIGEIIGPASTTLSDRIKIHNNNTAASSTIVYGTASAASETDVPAAIRFLFDDADADLFVKSAQAGVGVAVDEPTETSTMGEFFVLDEGSTSRCYVSQGTTITTFQQAGGINNVKSAAAITNVIVDGGELSIGGDQVVTALEVNGNGRVFLNNRGGSNVSVTTLTQNNGEVDCTEDSRPVTVTTWNFYGGRRILDRHVTITTDARQNRRTESVSKV